VNIIMGGQKMSVSKKTISSVACSLFLAAAILLSGVPAAQAETVVIDGPFGDVPLGSMATSAIQVNAPATTAMTLTGMSFASGSSSQFSVNTTLPSSGIELAPGSSTLIEVAFIPVEAGPASATLVITTRSASGWTVIAGEIHLNLTGNGLDEQAKQPDTADAGQVQSVLDFFDTAVAAGTLEGKGKGKKAKKRLRAARKMLKSVDKKLKRGKHRKACKQLRAISKNVRPLVKGEAKGELKSRLRTLKKDICK